MAYVSAARQATGITHDKMRTQRITNDQILDCKSDCDDFVSDRYDALHTNVHQSYKHLQTTTYRGVENGPRPSTTTCTTTVTIATTHDTSKSPKTSRSSCRWR
eukprot:9001582-Pyramimonas_sp.AAC.1